jgi:hypothetical protein
MTLNEWKIHPYMSVLKLPLLVDLQQKVGELLLFAAFCPSLFYKTFKFVYRKNVVMATVTTGIMFLLFGCMHFSFYGILVRLSANARSLRNTVPDDI